MAVNITNRADAEALIREQIVSTIFQDAPKHAKLRCYPITK